VGGEGYDEERSDKNLSDCQRGGSRPLPLKKRKNNGASPSIGDFAVIFPGPENGR
jgi:hypothetical protein